MKNIIMLLLLLLLAREKTYAQDLVNGNFANNCGSYFAGGCVPDFSVCVPNWIRTNGTPCFEFSVTPLMNLQTYEYGEFGSQGIAANYNFVKNGCYTITINLQSARSSCDFTTLQVWATSGLTEPAIGDYETSPPSTGLPAENIAIINPTSGVDFSGVLTFTYHATRDNNQLLIFVNQQGTSCYANDPDHDGDPGDHDPDDLDPGSGLAISISSVAITSCGCNNEIFNVSHNSQIAPGGAYTYSAIEAGSSVAVGSDPLVSAPANNETVFRARWIALQPNFSAPVMNIGSFFEAIPVKICNCYLESPIYEGPRDVCGAAWTVQVGTTLDLYDATPGGTWSGDDDYRATVVSSTGVVTGISTGNVDITYTIGDCSTTQRIVVINPCGSRSSNVSTNNSSNNIPNEIEISPNPAQSNITITYPCQANGQLDISVNDLSGRTLYAQTVSCETGNSAQQVVDMSSFAAGVYFVNLTLNDQHVVKKVVKY